LSLPPYVNPASIRQRLQVIFPEGVPQRGYCIREAAASTVFTMLGWGNMSPKDDFCAMFEAYVVASDTSKVYAAISSLLRQIQIHP